MKYAILFLLSGLICCLIIIFKSQKELITATESEEVLVLGDCRFLGIEILNQEKQNSRTIWIAEREVTCEEYCVFLNEVAYEESDIFPIKGIPHLVSTGAPISEDNLNKYYLLGGEISNLRQEAKKKWRPKNSKNDSVFGISYYGAVAYCEWFSIKVQAQASLPTELEWELAATTLHEKMEGAPGGVWEWIEDWYHSGERFSLNNKYMPPLEPENRKFPKKVIRGGNYLNRKPATVHSRAANLLFFFDENGPEQGFRIVLRDLPRN